VAQIIPIDLYAPSSSSNHSNGDVSVKRVSSAEQTVDQAKNDLERENIKPVLVQEAFHSTTSARGRKRSSKRGENVSKEKKKKSTKPRIYTIKTKKDIFQPGNNVGC
jgi:hypothetical protein